MVGVFLQGLCPAAHLTVCYIKSFFAYFLFKESRLSYRRTHQAAAAAMAMGDGHTQGVGGVVGLGYGLQVQHHAGHFLDLLFYGLAVAGDGLLDLHGRVFIDRHTALGRRQQDDPACLGHADDGGLVVLVVKLLDGESFGLVAFADVQHTLVDLDQALLKGGVFLGNDRPVAHRREPVAHIFHNAPAYNCVAGIDTKDPQVSTPPHFNWYSIPQKGVCVHSGGAVFGRLRGRFRVFSEKFQIS